MTKQTLETTRKGIQEVRDLGTTITRKSHKRFLRAVRCQFTGRQWREFRTWNRRRDIAEGIRNASWKLRA